MDEEVILVTLDLPDLLVDRVRRDTLVCKVEKVTVACLEKLEISAKQVQLVRQVPLVPLAKLDPWVCRVPLALQDLRVKSEIQVQLARLVLMVSLEMTVLKVLVVREVKLALLVMLALLVLVVLLVLKVEPAQLVLLVQLEKWAKWEQRVLKVLADLAVVKVQWDLKGKQVLLVQPDLAEKSGQPVLTENVVFAALLVNRVLKGLLVKLVPKDMPVCPELLVQEDHVVRQGQRESPVQLVNVVNLVSKVSVASQVNQVNLEMSDPQVSVETLVPPVRSVLLATWV